MMRKKELRERLLAAGAVAVGFARAEKVGESDRNLFEEWLAEGCHGGMEYMHNYPELRFDAQQLHEGCRTVISLAFPYRQPILRDASLPKISQYAYGKDYHKVLRKRLKPVVRDLDTEMGSRSRICIDSAPVRERYWAWKSGVGFFGLNGQVIVPGEGSYLFLAEIFTTAEFEADAPLEERCLQCGRCVSMCPGGAITGKGGIDARRCLSYLTIEHRGELSDAEKQLIEENDCLFGCDVCQQVCPHNEEWKGTQTLEEFRPDDFMLTMTRERVKKMSGAEIMARFTSSPLRRAGTDLIKC